MTTVSIHMPENTGLTAYSGQLEARYHEAAWHYTLGRNGIILTTLKEEWDVQPDTQ